ncbi:MAG: TonB-dependent siderophore receptor [Rhodocyclaceae bacterium]|jgi:catecholate siderophore receptor|nr:TonB-dependent siderophore receptor [Rhodocyclaceae bacterium]
MNAHRHPLPLFAALLLAADPALAQETTLSTVKVEAEAEQQDGYRATATRVGKVLQDPHDIPQAVTTLTSALLEEQQVGSLKEAMRNISGLSFNAAEGGRSGDNMNLRGFYTFGDLYLDGIRDTAQYNRETFNFEQIDVLRGAGAMLFGRGQAGGVVNMVSKTPLSIEQYRLTASLGNDDYREVTADLSKPINAGTALRVNLMQRDEGSWRSNPATGSEPEIHRKGAAFSLALNRDSHNRFWLNHYYIRTNDNPDYGVSFDAATRRPSERDLVPGRETASLFWGTDRTFDKSETSITTLVNEHRLSPVSELRTQLRMADYERSYWAIAPSLTTPPAADGWTGSANSGKTRTADYETITLQSDYSTKFATGRMKHELLAGFEYLKENSFRSGLQNQGGTTAGNPPWYLPDGASAAAPNRFASDSYAVYAQDTVEFLPQWKATMGVRRDRMDAAYSSATSPRLRFDENSYRTALSFHPSADTHYYLGWSDSFSPTADLYQLTVAPQPPERSAVVELGAKWLLMDGDLALRAALYRATKHWERSTDLESTASILTRKRRTDGLELEAAGRVTDAWEVFAGIALMDARILDTAENINATTGVVTKGNPEYIGKRARNTPKYTLNVWTTYKLGGGWKLGAGVEAKGDRQAVNPSGAGAVPTLDGSYHPNTAPAYERWDAMLAYEQAKWAIRLNIKNLFDKLYWESVYDNGGFAIPGPRRMAVLTAEMRF